MSRHQIDTALVVRTVAFALRHHPTQFGLTLDGGGWAAMDELLLALRIHRPGWFGLTRGTLEQALACPAAARFEVSGGRVRARYGFSVPRTAVGDPQPPPGRLFHGLPRAAVAAVLRDGLWPMCRQFVHLTTDRAYAARVATTDGDGFVLEVAAVTAAAAGRRFYPANHHVWLTDAIPPAFLRVEHFLQSPPPPGL